MFTPYLYTPSSDGRWRIFGMHVVGVAVQMCKVVLLSERPCVGRRCIRILTHQSRCGEILYQNKE